MACFFSLTNSFLKFGLKGSNREIRSMSSLGLACQIVAWQDKFISLGHHLFFLLQWWGGFVENEDGQFGL